MKLLTYHADGLSHVGAMTDAGIVDLDEVAAAQPAAAQPATGWVLTDLLLGGDAAIQRAAELVAGATEFVDPAGVRIGPPIPAPRKFLGVGGNFRSHIAEVAHKGFGEPPHPVWFNKQVTCVNGPFDEVLAPRGSVELDYEGEIGVVIGRRCRQLTVADAMTAVAGFVVVNDVSVRDWQMRAPTSTVGKSFDTHGPFGPWVVTPDEVGDHHDLRVRTWVNDEVRQDGSTAEMIFGVAELVSDLSQFCTLEVGDVLALGSPAGVGGLHTPPKFLRAGDVVRVEVERIGAIENRVVAEPAYRPL